MTELKKVLVKEKLAPEGVKYLEDLGFQVDIGTEWDADELLRRIPGYHGLIIRSATKVTADVIAAGENLQVVGRAGVGVDNVDVKEATKRGVIVVNAPQSNVLSAAEQTIALLMASARNLAQAHADLKAGEWNKGKWGKGGVEVRGKTLGIIGLGRIGFLVAEDARGLGMNVLAYDPFVPAEKFHELGLERADSPDKIYREADFITVHLPKNAETLGFISDDEFAKMKDGVRVINVARGGIIDEEAWARAIESGKVVASAVDVYPKEPTTESPLFRYDSVVATPHLGASTVEAQLRAGMIIAEQVAAVLLGQFASNAVNIPLAPGEDADELMPFLGLCEQLGKLIVQIADGPVDTFEIAYGGGIARYDTRILTLGVLQGILADKVDGPVNFVNVQNIAEERGITAKETQAAGRRRLPQPHHGDRLRCAGRALGVGDHAGPEAPAAAGQGVSPGRRHRAGAAHGVPALRRRAGHDRQDRHQGRRVRHQHRPDGRRPRGQGPEGRHGADARRAHQPRAAGRPGRELRARRRQAGGALETPRSADERDGAAGRKGPPPHRSFSGLTQGAAVRRHRPPVTASGRERLVGTEDVALTVPEPGGLVDVARGDAAHRLESGSPTRIAERGRLTLSDDHAEAGRLRVALGVVRVRREHGPHLVRGGLERQCPDHVVARAAVEPAGGDRAPG